MMCSLNYIFSHYFKPACGDLLVFYNKKELFIVIYIQNSQNQ
jgi:hypothetical protein